MKTENKTPLQNRLNAPESKIPPKGRTEQVRQGFRRISAVPTAAPRNYYESIAIYVSGATYRLYVYDEVAAAWRYTALT